ncbi:hypothetical protein KFK09_019966 [Dendrobium nobile]|uniref:Uncharacterized protein n=1 Tax=Dendrobium nobile TaxID=94219 RepID=A0A8T3AY36_DENNO|nr:hypothetical protein KFK09_019966 [Dendrobium nobile]
MAERQAARGGRRAGGTVGCGRLLACLGIRGCKCDVPEQARESAGRCAGSLRHAGGRLTGAGCLGRRWAVRGGCAGNYVGRARAATDGVRVAGQSAAAALLPQLGHRHLPSFFRCSTARPAIFSVLELLTALVRPILAFIIASCLRSSGD